VRTKLASVVVGVILIGGAVSSSMGETISAAFDQNGNLHMSVRALSEGMDPIEGTIRELVAGPTEEEAAQGVMSAIPAGTEVVAVTLTSDSVVADLSPAVLSGLSEALLDNMLEQLRISLTPFDRLVSYRLTCNGAELSSYLPQTPSVARPRPRALPLAQTLTTGLAGRKITIGPSHGRFYNGSGWYWMRSDPCGFGEAVLEDTNSIRLMQFLKQYLEQDSATVFVHRDLNESDCCNTATGLAWWKMCTHYWLRSQGLPCSVWGAYTGDCTSADGTVDRNNDDLWARPFYADYMGSDIYLACHTNAGGSGTANGTETFRYSSMEHPAQIAPSLTLATNVQNGMIDAIRNAYDASWSNRGVKDSNFAEIRKPDQPAVLIELAFHDNCTRDGIALMDNYFRSLAEWGVYKGICDYFGVTPTWDKYSCEYISDTIPATMEQGNYYPVSVTFRNRGVVWKSARSFNLGAVDDSDPLTTVTRVAPTGEVKPGATFTFNFTMHPLTQGTFTTDWQMMREGVAWFGPVLTKSVEVTANPDVEPPTTPTNLTATAINPTKVQLNWTASTDNFVVAGYEIRRDGAVIATSATNSYADMTATPGGTFTYDVRAYDNVPGQYSGWSDPATATTPLTDTVAPTTPAGLTAVAEGPTTVRLNWTASTDNTAVTGYNIRRNSAIVATSATNTYTDTVSPNTSNAYEVQAYDAAGNLSDWSNTASVTTPGVNVVVFSDGFDGNLSNWTQSASNTLGAFSYNTTRDKGTYTGAGAAYCPAGAIASMYYSFTKPFAQCVVSGYFYDPKGGYKTGCTSSYRQYLSLREYNNSTGMYYEHGLYSPSGAGNYYYRILGTGGAGTHTSLGTRNPSTACTGDWIYFETTISPGAAGATPAATVTLKAVDGVGTKSTVQNVNSTYFTSYGFARINIGMTYSSANECYWDDIAVQAAPPGIPTAGTPSSITASQIRWNFAPVDNYAFGFDIADEAGTAKSPAWPATGWLTHNSVYRTETGLAANTQYTRKVRAWNGTLNSNYSATVSAYTLSRAPSATYVTSDKTTACVGDSITWTAIGGFGAGTVQSYLYVWDQNPTYAFTGTEDTWSIDTLSTQVASPGTWYLHLKGYNAAGVANGTYDATITMTPETTITGQPADKSICAGASTTFTVTATGSSLTYRWQKQGSNLAEGGHYAGVTTATLTVSSADNDDVAGYACVVTGDCNSVATSNTATLTLKTETPITITEQPVSQKISTGAAATFNVSATGTGTLSYRWRKGGVPLADGDTITGATTATLTINPTGPSDVGNYDVVVTCDCTSATSAPALLCSGSAAADLDQDCDVDIADFDLFAACASGPGVDHNGSATCQNADLDDDNDVDQTDFGIFQRCISGENVMADPACAN
jgi:hypothetical protein